MILRKVLARILVSIAIFAPALSSAADPLRIDEAIPISSTKGETVIDVSGTYDGSQGVVFVSITAWRKDNFSAAGPKATPGIVTTGHFKVSVPISAPREALADSNRFVVTVVRENGSKILKQTFEWPSGWLPASPMAIQTGKSIVRTDSITFLDMAEILTESRFGEIESLATPWLDGSQYSANAIPMISYFTVAMKSLMVREEPAVTERLINAWSQAYPKSDLALYARALWWRSSAVRLSPTRPDPKTDKGIAAAWRRRIQSSDDVLVAMKNRGKPPASPLWHELHLSNTILLGKSQADIDAVFESAVQAYPDWVYLYSMRAANWIDELPPGDNGRSVSERILQLAQRLEKNSAPRWGKGAVALYYIDVEAGRPLQFDIFANGMVHWPSLNQAFRDLTSRYFVDFYLNKHAAYACRVGDRETYYTLRPTIANHIYKSSWRSNLSIDLCDSRYLKTS
jgi:hypothetical protein